MQLFQNINGTISGSDLIPYGNDEKILDIVLLVLSAKSRFALPGNRKNL